jgi:hypothetical protein
MSHFTFTSLRLCAFILLLLSVSNHSQAQSKSNDIVINQWVEKPLSIDGKLSDWGDSLKYFDEHTQFSFDIRNNQTTLYLAIKSNNKQNLSRILSRGVSFSVNAEGKKKNGPTIIFPVIDRLGTTNKSATEKGAPQDQIKEKQQQVISKITKMNVVGFADIIDGAVSLNNNYGLSASANFDGQDNFIIELAVPFSLLNISTAQRNIACLLQINGIKQPRSSYDPNRNARGGMYGNPSRDYGYDRRPPVNKQNLISGFWIKSTLATKQ